MIPTTLSAVLAFFAFVLPGLTFDILRRTKRKESAFREIGRVAGQSLLFSGPAGLLTVGVFGAIDPGWLQELGYWAVHSHPPTGMTIALALLAVTASSCVSMLAVLVLYRRYNKRHPRRPRRTLWDLSLDWMGSNDWAAIVTVSLDNGDRYRGVLSAYTGGDKWDEREMILSGPATIDRHGLVRKTNLIAVTFPATRIVAIETRWVERKLVAMYEAVNEGAINEDNE